MLMIENQERTAIYDIAGKSISIGGINENTIFISDKVSIHEGAPAVLGIYNDKEEALRILDKLKETIINTPNTSKYNAIVTPKKEERKIEDEQEQEEFEKD